MDSLETRLRKAGWQIAAHQLGRFFKIPEEMQQTPCDFMGFTSFGRAILIEAKQVERQSLPIGSSPGLLSHQWSALQEASRAGAVSLVAWQRGDYIAVFPTIHAEVLSEGRKSIPWHQIDPKWIHSLTCDPVDLIKDHLP